MNILSLRIRTAFLAALALPGALAHAQSHEHADTMAGHDMPSAFGPYSMAREGSGTAWQPESLGMSGLMIDAGPWSLMAHGAASFVYDDQGGPRGGRKSFAESMLMGMASRPAAGGTLGVRGMVSLDPAMGRGGYPLLFQSGETADGREHLVDRQHPHDAFMELAASYSHRWGEQGAAYLYAGLPGEPALGPSAFMHRASGMASPEAPITHHWIDSTHVAMGVVTVGASYGSFKAEASRFRGREPDQSRWNVESGRLDSSSWRLSWNPSSEWSLQVSRGRLHSPEQLEPEADVVRTTASAMYQAHVGGRPWATTLAWGRNAKSSPEGSRSLDGWLVESMLQLAPRHSLFTRIEQVGNDELLEHDDPRAGTAFRVRKASLGYVFDVARSGPAQWSVGGLVSGYEVPAALRPDYGRHPTSSMVFVQARF